MKKYGLFIGVDEYEDPGITPLHCAARDARELAAVFKHKLGFTTEVLTDIELGRERRRIMPVLRKIGEQLVEGDIFVFFFAGHGKSVGDTDQLFLLPDASSRALDSGVTSGEGMLSYRLLRAETDHWQGVQRGFIFDACRLPIHIEDATNRDGTAAAHFEGEIVYRDPGKGFNKNKKSGTPFIILNSCHDQGRAEELQGYEGGHGLFTAALLETVKNANARNKQMVIDENLALSLGSTMQALAQKYERRDTAQRPLFVAHGSSDLHLFGMEDLHEQQIATLLADFERQLARGNLERPVGDNCRDTLHRLANLSYDNAAQQGLSVRLQARLDEVEKEAKRQRDQQRIEVARKLAKTGAAAAYGNYLATCELCEHSDEADAAIEGEQQQQAETEQAKAIALAAQKKADEDKVIQEKIAQEKSEQEANREAAERARVAAEKAEIERKKEAEAQLQQEKQSREATKSLGQKNVVAPEKKSGVPGWAWISGVVVLGGLAIVLMPGENASEPPLPEPIKPSAIGAPASAVQVQAPTQKKSAPEPPATHIKAESRDRPFTKSDGGVAGTVVATPKADNTIFGIAGKPLRIYQPKDGLLNDYAPYQSGILALSDYMASHPSTSLRLEGHTDQRKSSEDSLALAQRYADNVMQYLVSHGFDSARLTAVSYGKEKPLDQGQSQESWAMNRRVEIRLFPD